MATTTSNKSIPFSRRPGHERYRSACDLCHRGKVKCAGGNPCRSCEKLGVACYYSISNRIGRPKGAKNKKTLDRLNGVQQQGSHGPNHPERQKTPRRKSTVSGSGKESPGIQFSSIPESDGQPFPEVLAIQGQGYASDDSSFLNSTETFWSMLHCMGPELGPSDNGKLDSSLLATLNSFNPQTPPPAPDFVSTHNTTLPRTFDRTPLESASCVPTMRSTMVSDFKNTDDFAVPSASNSMPLAACDCLQRQAELLSRLKILNKQHAYLQIDSVMIAARHAFDSWNRLMKCTVCHQDGGQEVLFLSVMGIRSILHSLKAVFGRDQDGNNTPDENLERSEQQASNGYKPEVRSTIGDYELTDEEKLLVTDTLLYSALGNIKSVLSRVKERIERFNKDFQQSIVTVPASRRLSLSTFPLCSHAGVDSSYFSPGHDHGAITTDGEPNYDSGYLMQLLQGAEDTIQSLTARSDRAKFLTGKSGWPC